MTQDFYEMTGVIKGGKITMDDPPAMVKALKGWADGGIIVRVERQELHPRRSNAQNKYWHAVVIPAFAEHCGYRFGEMKDALALELIPRTVRGVKGVERCVPGHTSDLSVKDFKELIERAQQLGAEMGIYIPDPGEPVTQTPNRSVGA